MNNCYIAIYDYYNNFLMEFVDLKSLASFLKLPLKKVSYAIRNDSCLIYNNHKIKLKVIKECKKNYGKLK